MWSVDTAKDDEMGEEKADYSRMSHSSSEEETMGQHHEAQDRQGIPRKEQRQEQLELGCNQFPLLQDPRVQRQDHRAVLCYEPLPHRDWAEHPGKHQQEQRQHEGPSTTPLAPSSFPARHCSLLRTRNGPAGGCRYHIWRNARGPRRGRDLRHPSAPAPAARHSTRGTPALAAAPRTISPRAVLSARPEESP